jgi:hypothetical protein
MKTKRIEVLAVTGSPLCEHDRCKTKAPNNALG